MTNEHCISTQGQTDDIDVDRDERFRRSIEGMGHRFIDDRAEATFDDFAHEVALHVLLPHPLHNIRRGPITTESDLDEAVAGNGARLDQSPHWSGVSE